MFGKKDKKPEGPEGYIPGALPCMTPLGCPEQVLKPGTPGFCPFFTQGLMEETNVQTGETRVPAECFMPLLARWMTYVVPAGNRAAASVDKLTNAVDAHNVAVGQAIQQVISMAGNGAAGSPVLPDESHGDG